MSKPLADETDSVNQFLNEFKGCGRKTQFKDWQAAERKAAQVLKKYGVKQRPYNCHRCGYVHLRTERRKKR